MQETNQYPKVPYIRAIAPACPKDNLWCTVIVGLNWVDLWLRICNPMRVTEVCNYRSYTTESGLQWPELVVRLVYPIAVSLLFIHGAFRLCLDKLLKNRPALKVHKDIL